MKQNWSIQRKMAAGISALAVLVSTSLGLAQNVYLTNTFDNADSVLSFRTWWGPSNPTFTWDDSLDADGKPTSGSVRYDVPFAGNASEQFMTYFSIVDGGAKLNATTYTNLSFDIKIDPVSGQRKNGNDYGYLEIGLMWNGSAYPPIGLGGRTIPLSATTWTHWNFPISPTLANLENVTGIYIKMWSDGAHTNNLVFNLDNFILTKPPGEVVIPPPTISPLEKAVPGLAFVASSEGQWDRQNIRTIGSNFSYIGRPGPVTYSVDIAKHAPVDGFRFHMFFVPGMSDPNRGDSDWHEVNCLMVAMDGSPSGGSWCHVHCKTNSPDSNGILYEPVASGGGDLGGFWANNGVGTWTVTFTDNTNLVVQAPDGASRAYTIPDYIMDVWKEIPGMQFAVGIMPGDTARVGNKVTIRSVKITGAADPLDVSFVGIPLDTTNTWTTNAANNGVLEIPLDAAYWVNWTLPANGFRLQTAATLTPGAWQSSAVSGYNAGKMHYTLLRQGDLPSAASSYFRLVKGAYSKLQILLPGETAAPGTPTGKTGTPTPQQVNVPFEFTVRAVDSEWFPVAGITNSIRLSSTDTVAILNGGTQPQEAALVNGVFTPTPGTSYFSTAGTWTIKVEDITDPTKTAYTTVPITVNP